MDWFTKRTTNHDPSEVVFMAGILGLLLIFFAGIWVGVDSAREFTWNQQERICHSVADNLQVAFSTDNRRCFLNVNGTWMELNTANWSWEAIE